MDWILDWIEYFNDPHHVAKIQRYFGIERIVSSVREIPKRKSIKSNQKVLSRKSPSSSSNSSGSDAESSEYDREGVNFIVHNQFWYLLFKFGTALGDEIFYASVFPFWFWNIDGAVGRRIINVWALSMFIGQCLKDVICWPRPACPPVVRMEKKWAMEYGMPSTHSMVSVTVPFSVILLTASRYEYSVYAGLAVAFIWCIVVSTSRLYLGMHSVADILGGLLLACLLLPVLLPLVDWLDEFLLTHPTSPILLVTTVVTLMLVYPGSKYSSAKEDTAVILGSAAGLLMGSWFSFQMGSIRGPPIDPPYSIIWPSYEMLGLSLLRTIIGLITVVATRALAKSLAYGTLKSLVAKHEDGINNVKEGLEAHIKLGCKLITYAFVGIDVTWFAPAIFRLLNIERPTFHTEI